jgi:hypothetical protein
MRFFYLIVTVLLLTSLGLLEAVTRSRPIIEQPWRTNAAR